LVENSSFMALDPTVALDGVDGEWRETPVTESALSRESSSKLCGVVLAGSHQWGDGAFAKHLRGPLLPVAHAPLIRYPLQWLHDAGVRSVLLCANTATPLLRSTLGDGSSMRLQIEYFEDFEPRGPAGCARDAALTSTGKTFVVIEGTTIPTLDFDALLATHRTSGAIATVVVESDRRRRGMVGGAQRRPAGIYLFERDALESVPETGYQDIKEGLLSRLNARGDIVAMHEVPGLSAKVLDYSSYASVSRWLVSRAVEHPGYLDGYRRVGDGLHHHTAFVHSSARLIGPVLIGAGARIDADAVVVGPASIGQRSIIGSGALISRAFIWDDCVIGAGASVDASVLADGSLVAAGEQLRSATQISGAAITFEHPSISRAVVAPQSELVPSLESTSARLRTGFADARSRIGASSHTPSTPRAAQ
jgi:NDP-sugar pyrophosphorylase family protein